ncbi:MAG TPA: lipoprotein insertase outer membrane protein LolB [Rhodocyclaceae bacterium]|nr:lipoprotein insertase outer membrane protein LolB [Rhodocyclaceae bacterium]HNA04857.1 lipoprotein insertase outer membrane protein LolB [Rhodocyclaceae bacterium]
MSMSLLPRAIVLALGCSLIAGCAGLAPADVQTEGRPAREAIKSFVLEGRVSITRATDRAQASIVWQHARGASDEIDLFTPVGSQLARLTATPTGAQLDTSDQRRFEAPDAETLSAQIFGSPLPLNGMPDWVLGRSAGREVTVQHDAAGRYAYLAEAGWVIRYLDYESAAPEALPRTLDFERGDLKVRLRIDVWRDLR